MKPRTKPKAASPRLLPVDSGEQIGLEEVGMVTDGTIDPWAQRLVAIYRTMSSVTLAMDGIRCIPGGADWMDFGETHDALTKAMALCGRMLLYRVTDTEADKSLARYDARHKLKAVQQ